MNKFRILWVISILNRYVLPLLVMYTTFVWRTALYMFLNFLVWAVVEWRLNRVFCPKCDWRVKKKMKENWSGEYYGLFPLECPRCHFPNNLKPKKKWMKYVK